MAGTSGHSKGQKRCDENNKSEGGKDVGQQSSPTRFVTASKRGKLLGGNSSYRVELRESLAEEDSTVLDREDGALCVPEGDALSVAGVRVVRVKLPALIDEIVIVGTVITDEVTILVRWVVNTRCAELVGFVDII